MARGLAKKAAEAKAAVKAAALKPLPSYTDTSSTFTFDSSDPTTSTLPNLFAPGPVKTKRAPAKKTAAAKKAAPAKKAAKGDAAAKKAEKAKKIADASVDKVITPSIVKKLVAKAGVHMRVASGFLDVVRFIVNRYLQDVVKSAVALAEHSKRKTVQLKDVILALKQEKDNTYHTSNKEGDMKRCPAAPEKKGDKAAHEAKHQARLSDCLLMKIKPFEMLVRKIAGAASKVEMSIQKNARGALQVAVETCIVDTIEKAAVVASSSHKKSLTPVAIGVVMENQSQPVPKHLLESKPRKAKKTTDAGEKKKKAAPAKKAGGAKKAPAKGKGKQ